ncbi:hypothetical protein OQA88_567 [Cercophora sp. LCS_1]
MPTTTGHTTEVDTTAQPDIHRLHSHSIDAIAAQSVDRSSSPSECDSSSSDSETNDTPPTLSEVNFLDNSGGIMVVDTSKSSSICESKAKKRRDGSCCLRLDVTVEEGKEQILRLKCGSVFTWIVDVASFPSKRKAKAARAALKKASKEINDYGFGFKFEELTTQHGKPTFVLRYDNDPPETDILAQAFLPSDIKTNGPPLALLVYPLSFVFLHKPFMWNTFRHEIIHMIGGRHVNCHQGEDDTEIRSVGFGPSNSNSIMAAKGSPRDLVFSKQDIKEIREYMGFPEGRLIEGIPIRDIVI